MTPRKWRPKQAMAEAHDPAGYHTCGFLITKPKLSPPPALGWEGDVSHGSAVLRVYQEDGTACAGAPAALPDASGGGEG